MAFLVANLSIPANDDDKIKDAFQNSLHWEYSKYPSPIYSLFLIQPKTAVIYAQKELVEDLLGRKSDEPFLLGGPMSLTFVNPNDYASLCVEINFLDSSNLPDFQYDILSSLRETLSTSNFASCLKENSVTLKFSNHDETAECIRALSPFNNNKINSRIIPVVEHAILRCVWKGPSTLAATIKRLKSTGQNITNFVQSCLSMWPEQPLILSLQTSPADPTKGSEEDEAILVCATQQDARILSASPAIELVGGSSIRIRQEKRSALTLTLNSLTLAEPREVYIFWDFDNCPLFKEDEASVVFDNIQSLIKINVGLHVESTMPTSTKLLYITSEPDVANRPTPQQSHDLAQRAFKTITYAKRGGVDAAMRSDVESLARKFKDTPESQRPFVCICTGDRDFTPTIANLRVAGISEIMLIHSRSTKGANSGLATRTFPWSMVRKYHNLSSPQKDEIWKQVAADNNTTPLSSDRGRGTTAPALVPSPVVSSTSRKSVDKKDPAIPENVEIIIELQWLIVAYHFKNLILWADRTHNPRKPETDGSDKRDKFLRNPAVYAVTTSKYLLGEKDENETVIRDEDSPCSVTLTVDQKEKKYRLRIVGPSADAADQRHKRLAKMIGNCNKDRKLHSLKSSWEIPHRECIMGSYPLAQEEKDSQATSLFHYNDGSVVVEIVSLNNRFHRKLLQFIEGLEPKDAFWSIPREIAIGIDDRKWSELHFLFAIQVEKDTSKTNSSKSTSISYRARGFSNHVDNALNYVLANGNYAGTTNTVNPSPSALSILNAPFSAHGHADKSSETDSFHKSSGQYIFQDREAGVYYQTFEKEFRQFIQHEFGVEVHEAQQTVPSDQKGVFAGLSHQAATRQQQSFLKLTFSSNDAKGVANCRAYLESMNATNLQRHQIFFPRADQNKYKEILSHKTKQDSDLQRLREEYASTFETGAVRKSENSSEHIMNPMEVSGFISIRIKPPLHSRGIKRMSLPSDVTVTVCSPIKSEEQRECLKLIAQSYESIDCGNAVATIELPSSSPITRQLTMRTSRDEFITNHNLMGLRYEEGSRASGVAGIARIYAADLDVLTRVIQYMEDNGAQNAHIIQTASSFVANDSGDVSPDTMPDNDGNFDKSNDANDRNSGSFEDNLNDLHDNHEFDLVSNITDNELDAAQIPENRSLTSNSNLSLPHQPYSSMFGTTFLGDSLSGNNSNSANPSGPPPGLFNMGSTMGGNCNMRNQIDQQSLDNGLGSWNQSSSFGIGPNFGMNANDTILVGGHGSSQLGGNKFLDNNQPQQATSIGGLGSLSGMNDMNNILSHSAMPSGYPMTNQMAFDFGGLGIEPINQVPGEKRVVRWPHHSFRFMFLGEPLKQNLNDLLLKMCDKHNLAIQYPHRDKSDHSACLLLEGSHASVNAAAEDINKYMRSIYQQMCCLQLVISEVDKKELISNDLHRVKDIQGQCGVHLVLDPLPTDMNEASSTYDLRLPYTDHLLFENPVVETESENEFRPLRELLSVVVTSKVTGQNVVVSVIDNKSSAGGWNWGVNNVLLMLDPSADVGLNFTEIEQLDKGEVLVNTENATGKRILRVRPERSSFNTRGIERQAEGFVAALSRGLAAADSLNINGIAVVAPTSTQYFTDLSVELIQSLTMEAIVAFIRRAPVRHVNKILCIEMQSQIDEQMSPAQYTEMSLLLPAGGDRMALTLLILLEQANDPQAHNQQQPGLPIPVPSIQLRTCNVPLPRNVRADDLLPSLAKNRPKVNLLPHQIPPVGTSPIILRGLTGGLRASLKTIKQLIASYAEARKNTESMSSNRANVSASNMLNMMSNPDSRYG